MTKKDYIKLANLIKTTKIISTDHYTLLPYISFVDGLIEILKSDNPNFDEVKFRKAIS